MRWYQYLILAIGLYVSVMVVAGCGGEKAVYELQSAERRDGEPPEVSDEESDGVVENSQEQEPPGEIVVHVCGAVTSPGVYTLPEGSRVYLLIERAGGLLEEADGRILNQAEVLKDGQQVIVYTKAEAADIPAVSLEGQSSGLDQGKVNLNTADVTQLTTLAGIGEARARAIIDYREVHGAFQSIEEIMKIEGIKEKLFEKIREQIEI